MGYASHSRLIEPGQPSRHLEGTWGQTNLADGPPGVPSVQYRSPCVGRCGSGMDGRSRPADGSLGGADTGWSRYWPQIKPEWEWRRQFRAARCAAARRAAMLTARGMAPSQCNLTGLVHFIVDHAGSPRLEQSSKHASCPTLSCFIVLLLGFTAAIPQGCVAQPNAAVYEKPLFRQGASLHCDLVAEDCLVHIQNSLSYQTVSQGHHLPAFQLCTVLTQDAHITNRH